MHGKKHGQGLVIYANGDCFEGYWRKDLREGEGQYWIKRHNVDNSSFMVANEDSGRLIKGVWKRDMMKTGIINEQKETEVTAENPKITDS